MSLADTLAQLHPVVLGAVAGTDAAALEKEDLRAETQCILFGIFPDVPFVLQFTIPNTSSSTISGTSTSTTGGHCDAEPPPPDDELAAEYYGLPPTE